MERVEHFGSFLDSVKNRITHLYVLGDLFDYWIGPGHENQPEYNRALRQIRAVADSGVHVYVLHGNRDFFLDSNIAALTRAEIAGDTLRLALGGKVVHLCHGDQLCRNDRGGIALRTFLRSPVFQFFYKACPFTIRDRLARRLRGVSKARVAKKTRAVTGFSDAAIERIFDGGVDVLVCGHTHRHGRRDIPYKGRNRILYNLGDWSQNGSYLLYAEGEFNLLHYDW